MTIMTSMAILIGQYRGGLDVTSSIVARSFHDSNRESTVESLLQIFPLYTTIDLLARTVVVLSTSPKVKQDQIGGPLDGPGSHLFVCLIEGFTGQLPTLRNYPTKMAEQQLQY